MMVLDVVIGKKFRDSRIFLLADFTTSTRTGRNERARVKVIPQKSLITLDSQNIANECLREHIRYRNPDHIR